MALSILALARGPATARADDGNPFVAWDAPAECPDRAQFVALLHGHLSAPPAYQVHVEVTIRKRGRRYRLTMLTSAEGNRGERRLQGRDCGVLADTAALTLALAIMPESAKPRRAPTLVIEDPPTHSPNARRDPVPATRSADAGPDLDVSARPLISADVGSLPHAGPGAGLAVAVHLRRWRMEGHAVYWFEQTARLNNLADGAHVSALAAGLRLCWRGLNRARLTVGACTSVEASRTAARGFGGFNSQSGSATHIAASLGTGASIKINSFMDLRVESEIVGRTASARPRFVFDVVGGGQELVHQPGRMTGRLSAGLELWFR